MVWIDNVPGLIVLYGTDFYTTISQFDDVETYMYMTHGRLDMETCNHERTLVSPDGTIILPDDDREPTVPLDDADGGNHGGIVECPRRDT